MNLDKAFGLHDQALIIRSQRAELLASNMANADTPNYKAKDFDFQNALALSSNNTSALAASNKRHITSSNSKIENAQLQYRVPSQPSLDGNTVDEDLERSEFIQNSVMYQTSLQFLNGRIGGLLTAIRGE